MKKCKVCGAVKPFGEFHKNKTGEGGVRNVCKICRLFSIRQERRSQKPKERKNGKRGKTKMCTNCKVEKHVSEFYEDKKNKSKLKSHCKECMRMASKLTNIRNKYGDLSPETIESLLRDQEYEREYGGFNEYKKIPKWYRELYL